MEKLIFDDGVIRLNVNGNGILAFNPSDFNIYDRLMKFANEVVEMEKEYQTAVNENDSEIDVADKELSRATKIDAKVKERLNMVFGGDNDFFTIFNGVNIMAFGSNGERVITNFLHAITPYIEKGLANHTKGEVQAAKANREQRRAAQKKAKA